MINLLFKQINKQRVELSSTPTVGISVFNAPRYDELLQTVASLFFANFSPQREKFDNNSYRGEVSELSLTYTLQMQEIMHLLAPFGISLDDPSEFVREPKMDNEVFLSPEGKRIRLTFRSYDQLIPITLLIAKNQLHLNISVITPKANEGNNSEYPTLSLTLTHKNTKTYNLNAELRRLYDSPKQPPERTLKGEFQLTEKNGALTINFDALMQITSLALADDQKLNIAIKGSETLQAT
jgi:hypothetical protein